MTEKELKRLNKPELVQIALEQRDMLKTAQREIGILSGEIIRLQGEYQKLRAEQSDERAEA